MPRVFSILLTSVLDGFRSRLSLQMELIALSHQVAVYQQSISRPKLRPADRLRERDCIASKGLPVFDRVEDIPRVISAAYVRSLNG
jgi:hypothetical protein